MRETRPTICHWEPTAGWVRAHNPRGKKEILAWYERQLKRLEIRRKKPIRTKFPAYMVEIYRDTGEVKFRAEEPEDFFHDLWKLSEQDYAVYRRELEKTFLRLKQEHNQRVIEKHEHE